MLSELSGQFPIIKQTFDEASEVLRATAVQRAMGLATEAGARRVTRLAVSVPAHCSLMQQAARKLNETLAETVFKAPRVEILHNVDVSTHTKAEQIRQVLIRQLYSPVRWSETIQTMAARGVGVILEMGPGRVLTALNRRIDRGLKNVCVQDVAGLNKALEYCKEVG
jgi:[acyl-carrier-protein] S-malonyltransferase